MTKKTADQFLDEMRFGDFVAALRGELLNTTTRLYEEMAKAKDERRSVHAFLLDQIEFNVLCTFDRKVAAEISGKLGVETTGFLKVLLGKGELGVSASYGQDRTEAGTTQVRIVMKPGQLWYDEHDEAWRWMEVFAKRE